MGAQKGRDVLVKFNTTGNTFVAVGGARESTLTIANEQVDITNADSAGVRTLLEGAGNNSVSIKLQGVYVDDTTIGLVRAKAGTNAFGVFQLVTAGTNGVTYEGSFQVSSFEEAAAYNGAQTYNMTLDSAGAITITDNA